MDTAVDTLHWDVAECDAFGRLVGLTAARGRQADQTARRLLVPVDGSPASLDALRLAMRMAAPPAGAELHLLNAQAILGSAERDQTLQQRGLADTRTALAALAAAQLPHVLRLVAGNPAEAIIAYAHRHGIAEIVMGTAGAGSVAGALLGSVAMDVLARADVPVTLVKSGQTVAEGGDWLLACDGSDASLRALRHALTHRADGAPRARIHLLNVRLPDGHLPGGRPDAPTLASRRTQAAVDCRRALRLLASADVAHDFHIATGDPVAAILMAAEDTGCGRIAMGTRGLSWLGSLLLGSISGGVLRRSHLPVTLCK